MQNPKDLSLSLHKVNYSFRSSNHNCYFQDYYDFNHIDLKHAPGIDHKAKALLNSYANYRQHIGAVGNYNI